MSNWAQRDKSVLWHPFTQMAEWTRTEPLVIHRGEGNFLFDVEGRKYLDGVSSPWCNLHGHNHPRLNAALQRQIEKLCHSTFLGLTHEPGIELAERLVRLAPPGLSRVFYSDSGSTAVEVALKQAFQYWQLTGHPKRRKFVRLVHAYHGDTLGAVGVGGIELFHRIFGSIVLESIPTPAPVTYPTGGRTSSEIRDEALRGLDLVLEPCGDEVAAIIVEPLVQGAAGMIMHPPGFLAGVASRCRQAGTLLIADEVATGFGRTGSMFACEQESVAPDFLCVAKGISAGYLPLAATLTRESIYEAFLGERRDFKAFFHGHTYTANPLACAVSIESIAMLEEGVLTSVGATSAKVADLLAAQVAPNRWVGDVRQRGLMVGIELMKNRETEEPFHVEQFMGAKVCDAARHHGVILRPLGDVIVWMPPLSIRPEELDLLAHATMQAINEVCH